MMKGDNDEVKWHEDRTYVHAVCFVVGAYCVMLTAVSFVWLYAN